MKTFSTVRALVYIRDRENRNDTVGSTGGEGMLQQAAGRFSIARGRNWTQENLAIVVMNDIVELAAGWPRNRRNIWWVENNTRVVYGGTGRDAGSVKHVA